MEDFTIIPVNIDPNRGKIFDPDMNLLCLSCGKDHKPYNHMVNHNYAFMQFCSDRCFKRYNSMIGKTWRAIKWPFWKIRSMWLIWYDKLFALPCRLCGKKMMVLSKDLQQCDDFDCENWGILIKVISRKEMKFEYVFMEDHIYEKARKSTEGEGTERTSKGKT